MPTSYTCNICQMLLNHLCLLIDVQLGKSSCAKENSQLLCNGSGPTLCSCSHLHTRRYLNLTTRYQILSTSLPVILMLKKMCWVLMQAVVEQSTWLKTWRVFRQTWQDRGCKVEGSKGLGERSLGMSDPVWTVLDPGTCPMSQITDPSSCVFSSSSVQYSNRGKTLP